MIQGSCWAFASIGVLECRKYLNDQGYVALSEQQLVDCDKKSFGCNGGYLSFCKNSKLHFP
jgi:hypothetical protein